MSTYYLRRVGASAAIATLLAGTAFLLARSDFFRVRQVELLGVRYLPSDVVLGALALEADQGIFSSMAALEERLQRVNGIIGATVERRLPGTLRVLVTERLPMAFAAGPQGLIPLDANAWPLPYGPSDSDLDLPMLARADTLLVQTLAAVWAASRDFYHEVDWVERAPNGGVRLDIGRRRLLMPALPTVEEVDAIRAVQQHLDMSGRPYDELDSRVGGWVIVRGGG